MTTKTLWVHIGTEKTGSTALQRFLFDNRPQLKKKGYHVLSSRVRHHGALRKELALLRTDLLDKAVEEIRSSPCSHFILSYEGLYSLQSPALGLLARRFAEFRVVPVLYLRRRSDKLRSNFAQRVKNGANVEEYSRRLLQGDFIEQNMGIDYLHVVKKWESVLSAHGYQDGVRVRIYEYSSLINQDVVEDFLGVICFFAKGESVSTLSLKRSPHDANASIGPAAQYIMVLSRALGLDEDEQRRLLDVLREQDHGRDRAESMIPDDTCDDLDKQFAADDALLARKYFGRDHLFLEPAKFCFKPPSGERFIELIETIAKNSVRIRGRCPGDQGDHKDSSVIEVE